MLCISQNEQSDLMSTLGTAACVLFSYRLYNYNNTNGPDPSINAAFLPTLRNLCPNGGDGSTRVNLDTGSPNTFDNSYFANLRNGRGVLESDQLLWGNPTTRTLAERFLGLRGLIGLTFNVEFARAMVKMGNLQPLKGKMPTNIEKRKKCLKSTSNFLTKYGQKVGGSYRGPTSYANLFCTLPNYSSMDTTMIRDLDASKEEYTLKVRIIRLWNFTAWANPQDIRAKFNYIPQHYNQPNRALEAFRILKIKR
ncbi:hypothetical protein LXL04_039006 [Taraxacum kok-saghyz]